MKRVQLGYFFREGIRGIFLHGFMSFAAVSVIVACLLIMGSVTLVALNVDHMIRVAERENEILVFVDETYTEAQAKSVGSKINLVDNVEDSIFVDKDEALEQYGELLGDDSDILRGLDKGKNPLRHRFRVLMRDTSQMAATKRLLEQIPGVASTNARLDISEGFLVLRNVVNAVSVTLIVVLFCVSVFIISNTVKLATFDRREEIAIMKVVGATNGFIRWPFIVEGFLLGVLGAIAAFFIQWAVYSNLTAQIEGGLAFLEIIPFGDLFYPLFGVFILTGFLVGAGGSVLTIRKFLNV